MSTVRLTMAQALVRYLINQFTVAIKCRQKGNEQRRQIRGLPPFFAQHPCVAKAIAQVAKITGGAAPRRNPA